MASAAAKTALVHRRLYRALLRTAKNFSPPAPDAAVLSCLLHRSFIPLEVDENLARQEQDAEDLTPGMHLDYDADEGAMNGSYPKRSDAHFLLFRRLLHDVFSGHEGEKEKAKKVKNPDDNHHHELPKKRARCLQFPSHIKERPLNLTDIIRREFRVPDIADPKQEERFSAGFTLQARRDCGFLALRRLNEKLYWADFLEEEMAPPCPQQAAKYVTPIPISAPPSTYLKPGTFLIAHPHLGGFFRRTVIVILQYGKSTNNTTKEEENENKEEEEEEESSGTYGIVINRVSLHEVSGKNRTLADVMSVLPKELVSAFGSFPVKDGGPVHMPSIQMLHACTPPDGGPNKDPSLKAIGGTRLPSTAGNDYSCEKSVYIQGDIIKAAEAVKTEHLDRDDVSFFIGASSWYPGQLEQEIQQGCWLPVAGPPEIALTGVCEHEPTQEEEPRPKADLWLSMMSSCGEDEARLAHLVANASEDDEYGDACDEF